MVVEAWVVKHLVDSEDCCCDVLEEYCVVGVLDYEEVFVLWIFGEFGCSRFVACCVDFGGR